MVHNTELPPLLVRADASAVLGAGHVMRCLALAQGWRARGGFVRFLSHRPDAALARHFESCGADVLDLDACYPDRRDLDLTIAILRQTAAAAEASPWVVLDGYHFDLDYQQSLRRAGGRLLVIDDDARLARYDADLIANHGLHALQLDYPAASTDSGAWLLLGTRHALLRQEFMRWRGFERKVADRAKNVLVTLGGGAAHPALIEVIAALQTVNDPALEVRVVVGPLHPLRRGFEQGSHIHLETAVSDMSKLMAWADLAIAAGGTTAWELAFMQTPMLLVAVADNQLGVAESLDEFGAAEFLGPADSLKAPELAQAVQGIMADPQRRRRMARRGAQLVDGRGVERVIAALLTRVDYIPGDGFWLRPVAPEDKLLCWQWANDPAVRANSFNPAPIPWSVHEEWFDRKIATPECRWWIMHIGTLPVGQVRYDRLDGELAELSYAIAPGFRGMKLGSELLKATAELAGRELGVTWVRGIAFADNRPSQRAMLNAGFAAATWQSIDGHDCVVLQRACVSPWSREFHVAVH